MTYREETFSKEYRELAPTKKAGDDESQPIDKKYRDPEKPRLVVIKAKIVSEEEEE